MPDDGKNPWMEFKVPLRENFYRSFELAIEGAAVQMRIQLNLAVPGVSYKYVIDSNGKVWLLRADLDYKHSSLVPPGESVYSAGELKIDERSYVNLNCSSGHYMREEPLLPTMPWEIADWRNAMLLTLWSYGMRAGQLNPSDDILR